MLCFESVDSVGKVFKFTMAATHKIGVGES